MALGTLVTFILALTALAHDVSSADLLLGSPFGHLVGRRKGETNVKDLHNVKIYRQMFGYPISKSRIDTNDFDESLESALKIYQVNNNLISTGSLDAKTLAQMLVPRCGLPDIINGTSRMKSGSNSSYHSSIHTHYAFFWNKLRWPPSKTHLRYIFLDDIQPEKVNSIEMAFNRWSQVTKFTFERVWEIQNADIRIGFYSRDHGDGQPFDGHGHIWAHAFAPTDGRMHFDRDEDWATSSHPTPGWTHLQTVALHEIGHLLGLEHSSVNAAVMWPYVPTGVVKDLHADDIEGIRVLYA